MSPKPNEIEWRVFVDLETSPGTLLIGTYNGISFSAMYHTNNKRFFFSKWAAKRKIIKAIKLLHSRHWI